MPTQSFFITCPNHYSFHKPNPLLYKALPYNHSVPPNQHFYRPTPVTKDFEIKRGGEGLGYTFPVSTKFLILVITRF